jgi:hypothetical protein
MAYDKGADSDYSQGFVDAVGTAVRSIFDVSPSDLLDDSEEADMSDDELTEHPDREDDDSTERVIAEAEFNLLRSNIKQIHRVADTALSDLEALRSQLELADDDGVCEWRRETEDPTAYPQYYGSECDYERKLSDEDLSTDTYCPGCGKPIEIVEEGEEPEFEVGDLIKWRGKYRIIIDTEYGEYEVEGEKVGHFQPTDDFFERVPEFVNGELVIEHMPDGHNRVGLWPGTKPGDIDYGVVTSKGESRAFSGEMTERTGIILSHEQLESIFSEEE